MRGSKMLINLQLILLITLNCTIIWGNLVNCDMIPKLNNHQRNNRMKRQSINNSPSQTNRISPSTTINKNNLITILKSLEINETTIKVNWRLKVINHNQTLPTHQSSKIKPKKSSDDHYIPTEWTLRVRQFGTLYVKLRFISEIINYSRLLITGSEDINFIISSLQDGQAYELCLQSAEFPVDDEITSITRRVSIINSQGEPEVDDHNGLSKMVCKEVVTRRSTCGNTLTPGKIATVTVVSSASTIIIVVVVGWCWCPNNNKQKDGQRSVDDDDDEDESIEDNQQVNNDNQRKWFKWFGSSASQSPSPSSTANQNNEINQNQRKIGKSLMVHNVNYHDDNNNYNVSKVKSWLTLWRKIKLTDQPILYSKKLETINIGGNCQQHSTIYRPKSWPQDEWTINSFLLSRKQDS